MGHSVMGITLHLLLGFTILQGTVTLANLPFSDVVQIEGTLYVSGKIGIDKDKKPLDGIEAQTHGALDALEKSLKEAGAGIEDVAKVTVYVTDIKDYKTVNKIYARRFKEPYPARTFVEVSGLPLGVSIEFDVIAKIPRNTNLKGLSKRYLVKV